MRERDCDQADETVDDLLINNLRLIQKQKGFRFTLDSVLVAHFATVKTGDRIVDLGTRDRGYSFDFKHTSVKG